MGSSVLDVLREAAGHPFDVNGNALIDGEVALEGRGNDVALLDHRVGLQVQHAPRAHRALLMLPAASRLTLALLPVHLS